MFCIVNNLVNINNICIIIHLVRLLVREWISAVGYYGK